MIYSNFSLLTIRSVYVYTNAYPATPSKPNNFVDACKRLEQHSHVPRSFQILIPRLLPALYEIRNNRNVGHVGGDVNPDFMDSNAVLSIASWILAELVRVFHNSTTEEAQHFVDNLVERRIQYIWKSSDIRRVLNQKLKLKEQVFILLASCSGKANSDDLYRWTEYNNQGYFLRLLRDLHKQRLIEFDEQNKNVEILPPGSNYLTTILEQMNT